MHELVSVLSNQLPSHILHRRLTGNANSFWDLCHDADYVSAIREMIGVIHLKQYQAMKERYDTTDKASDYMDLLATYLETKSKP
jgi:hypothetical protein